MSYVTKPNPEKQKNVAQLEETIGKAEGIIFTDFTGLSVAEINELRSKFFEAGEVDYLVAKNTLTRIALNNKGYIEKHAGLDDVLRGPTGMAIGYADAIKPVKIIADYARESQGKPVFKGGLVEGDFFDSAGIEKLKNIPPVEVLQAMVLGGLVSPLSGFIGVINEIVRSFVGVIDAIIEKKKAEEGAGA